MTVPFVERSPDGGWHYRRSLASRVTLLTTIAVGLVVAMLSVAIYALMRHQLVASADQNLMDRAQAAAGSSALLVLTQDEIPAAVISTAEIRIAFVDNDGVVHIPDRVGGFPPLSTPELAVAQHKLSSSIRTISAGNQEYRVVAVPTMVTGERRALVLAQALTPQEHLLHRLSLVMLFCGLVGVLFAALAGWGVAVNGLRPVRRLTRSVEEISPHDLAPLPVEGDDEIARLATAFNGLLAALSASQERQRQLIADAGHELRTPLTSMRTNIDLLTQADLALEPAQRAELLTDVRAQMEELTALIGDLVELARDEPLTPVVEAVELHEVVDHAVARVRLRAPLVSFEVDAQPWWVVGESNALERAITNLLDNAAKWSPPDGTVHVTLRDGVLTVDDQGPGIPEGDRPHVFDRFYRAAESRAMPGSGLGLAIVRQTAERHGGTVAADQTPEGGARLVLRIPGAAHAMPKEAPHR
ncbi:HAMP domain-containing sensor histidine kinase [Nocardioides sp. CER19]|uniref:HAMP domain-containing sensor histidine kinase n=1 Tax=Nocardioides sp. CER19 TaxID=3038538 RepID=UPI002449AC11|nr:HAMP domain-containing sensor histidine kinase [Nocardioides sp. CER19]MDH2412658.1 HAMP domain-containing sensor histidine kinase [Nocardioides sp. CER19]